MTIALYRYFEDLNHGSQRQARWGIISFHHPWLISILPTI